MTAYLLTVHLLNFVAPAAAVAILLVLSNYLFSRFLQPKRSMSPSFMAQAAIIFVTNIFILIAGLVFFGNDGKVATFAVLVLGSALCQWVLNRGWRA